MTQTKTEILIERMLSFDGSVPFDSYPTMTCADDGIISDAVDENEAEMRAYEAKKGSSMDNQRDPLGFLVYLASEHARTPEQFNNARRYIREYVQVMWECNMIEGQNPVYADLSETNQDCSLI